MKELFSFGPIHIYFFGLMIALGIIAASIVAIKEAERQGIGEDIIIDIIIVTVISGIVGARIFYILFYNPSFYLNNPMEVFHITEGGLSIHGGIVTAIASGFVYSKIKKASFFKLADITVIAVALAQGIGRVGCDVFGKPMSKVMPWGINVAGEILHPAQVYEFILDYILFFILWRKRDKKKYEGQLFIIYFIGFSIIRGIVEFFRINPLVWGPFSVSHLLSFIFIVIGVIIYALINRRCDSICKGHTNRYELLKQLGYLILLVVVSLIIFYYVQG